MCIKNLKNVHVCETSNSVFRKDVWKDFAVTQHIVLIIKYCNQHKCPTIGSKVNELQYLSAHLFPWFFPVLSCTTVKPVTKLETESFKNVPPFLSTSHFKFYHLPKDTGSYFIDALT